MKWLKVITDMLIVYDLFSDNSVWPHCMTGRFTILRNTYSGCVPGGFFCILDRSAYGSGVEIGFLGVIFFFFVVCKVIMRAAWMLKRGQNRKRWVFFRLRFSFRAAVTLTLWTREVEQLLCGYFSPMEKEKKKTPKNRQLRRLSRSQFSRG